MLRLRAGLVLTLALAACGPHPSLQVLVGRWSNTSGSVTLEITEIGRDGTVAASYFTTHPVRITRATARAGPSSVRVRLWLEDREFPPATLDLEWTASSGRLEGVFEQAGRKTRTVLTKMNGN